MNHSDAEDTEKGGKSSLHQRQLQRTLLPVVPAEHFGDEAVDGLKARVAHWPAAD